MTKAKLLTQHIYLGKEKEKLEELLSKEKKSTGYEINPSALIRRLISEEYQRCLQIPEGK